MDGFGELLYAGKTDNNKNGIAFILFGIIFMVIGGVFLLVGLYLLLFRRSEKFSIYENMIVLTLKGQELSIPKDQIIHIEYQKLKTRRSPVVNYYPVLILNDPKKLLINKSFNSIVNQDFKNVIESYI
mgnify:CR=1 FL=1